MMTFIFGGHFFPDIFERENSVSTTTRKGQEVGNEFVELTFARPKAKLRLLLMKQQQQRSIQSNMEAA
jgi:hypothetical protein